MLRDALVESHSKTGRFNEPVCTAMVRAIADAIQQVRTDARLDD